MTIRTIIFFVGCLNYLHTSGKDRVSENLQLKDTTPNFGVYIGGGIHHFKIHDWELESKVYNYPAYANNFYFGAEIKPAKAKFYLDLEYSFGKYSEKNVDFNFIIDIGGTNVPVCISRDVDFRYNYINFSALCKIYSSHRIRWGMGIGFNRYSFELKKEYHDPENCIPYFDVNSIVTLNKSGFGFRIVSDFNVLITKKIAVSLAPSLNVTALRHLNRKVEPITGFDAPSEKDHISFTGMIYQSGIKFYI